MADPILIDDGGSIRIRQIGPNTNLDGLLDGRANANNPTAIAFNTMRVEHHFRDGTNHLHPPGGPGAGTTRLNPGDVITISSASGHIVQVTLVTAAVLQLDLTKGNPALVEAKSVAGQRSYRITNADVIQTIAHSAAGVIFDNTAAAANLPSAFTIVSIF